MKKLLFILALSGNFAFSQCNYNTNERPDGNIIKYFNPKPIIRQAGYEVGASINYNATTKKYYINIAVLLKTLNCNSVEKKLNIQLKNSTQSISLGLTQFNKTQMNGKDVIIALYELDTKSLNLLKKYSLKTVYFTMQSKIYGSTINENNNLLINELKCL
jgi:hypothetical protein